MSEWKNIKDAPFDTAVFIETAGGYQMEARIIDGFMDEDEDDVCGWVAVNEGDCPECWHNDVCWKSNADMNPSDPPIKWREIENDQ